MERILVVDDEADCQTVLAMYLESQGYRVQSATSGIEALSIFESDPPDLVISDVMMPEMDGFEFYRRLRRTRLGQLERSHRIHAEIVRLLQNSTALIMEPKVLPVAPPPAPLPLTPAEERVFWEVIQGSTNKQISHRLFISPRTVQAHLGSIFSKLHIENRAQLVKFALDGGYKPPQS